MRYVIHITTLREPIRFFAQEAHQEGLDYIHRWPLTARNQPCGLRIEESPWLFTDVPLQGQEGVREPP
jgi:hypothetical protein